MLWHGARSSQYPRGTQITSCGYGTVSHVCTPSASLLAQFCHESLRYTVHSSYEAADNAPRTAQTPAPPPNEAGLGRSLAVGWAGVREPDGPPALNSADGAAGSGELASHCASVSCGSTHAPNAQALGDVKPRVIPPGPRQTFVRPYGHSGASPGSAVADGIGNLETMHD